MRSRWIIRLIGRGGSELKSVGCGGRELGSFWVHGWRVLVLFSFHGHGHCRNLWPVATLLHCVGGGAVGCTVSIF